ncbi:MAG: hypothetical protein ABL911_09975 [Gallionella sp.]|nr:hypothetical protein [Gallionella sp.]
MSNNEAMQKDVSAIKKRIFWFVMRHHKELQQTAEIQINGDRIYSHQCKKPRSKPIGEILMQMKIIDAEDLTRALCIQSGILMADLNLIDIPKAVLLDVWTGSHIPYSRDS